MTASSKSFRIPNYSSTPLNGLNQFWVIGNVVFSVDNQSTIFKESGSLSFINKQEIQRIRSFFQLEKNWDSYDSEKIDHEVISKAIDMVKDINALDEDVYFTAPGPNGEIMIQLKKENKEVEIIIYDSKIKYVSFVDNEFEKQGSFGDSDILPEIIRWLNI